MDYEKNICPYDAGQLLVARDILSWAIDECPQLPNNVCMNNVFELIDNAILKEVARQVRFRRLEDYTIDELLIEIESRNKE